MKTARRIARALFLAAPAAVLLMTAAPHKYGPV